MSSTVLVITNDHDSHASAVIAELHKRCVPVFRFQPEDFPDACSISMNIRDGRIDRGEWPVKTWFGLAQHPQQPSKLAEK